MFFLVHLLYVFAFYRSNVSYQSPLMKKAASCCSNFVNLWNYSLRFLHPRSPNIFPIW